MNAISLRDLRKCYGENTWALKGVKLDIPYNKIFCIVGPNGAGKTTLLRILGTQLLPTSGTAYVLGYDVVKEANKIRNLIGVIPQEATVDPELTPWEHIFYYLGARGVNLKESKKRTDNILRNLDLFNVRSKPTACLSGGFRRRVLIGMIIATEAKIMFLDEPTTGLDPLARQKIWDIISELKRETTVLLTTHSMEEAEALADNVAIIDQGEILTVGSPSELKSSVPYSEKVYIEGKISREILEPFGEVKNYGGRLVVYPYEEKSVQEILKISMNEKIVVSLHPISLEDVFIRIIGERVK